MATSRLRGHDQAFFKPIVPSLQAGAATGVCGFLAGGSVGILRSSHPGLAATFTGVQFFALGSSFLYTREVLLESVFPERTKRANTISSTVAGAVSGAVTGAFYGRVNSVSGALMIGGVGYLGQKVLNAQEDGRPSERDVRPFLDRLADSRWMPFKSLSHDEYQSILTEKLLKVEAELTIIDEKIASLHDVKSRENEKSS